MSWVAWLESTDGPPPRWRTSGQSSIAPDTTATASMSELFCRNLSSEGSTAAVSERLGWVEKIARDLMRRHGSMTTGSAHYNSPTMAAPHHKLVLLRHGESQWNLENRFTGW